ncbi:hypothetical protein BC940DRAFT_33939 [Gongronella butleri]|nr:hypothetical protein BC940DRAFT_33939 [Gongronella butleri]
MAKKKKIKNMSGYATTSLPSRASKAPDTRADAADNDNATSSRPDPVADKATKQDDSQPSGARRSSGASTATTVTTTAPALATVDTEEDTRDELDVDRLVEKFKPINDRKADGVLAVLDMVQGSRAALERGRVDTTFELKAEAENRILDMARQRENHDLFDSFFRKIRRRSSDTEKDRVVGTLDVMFRALVKLGFDVKDVEQSMGATVSTVIEDHLDWLCFHVPYDRMPPGFFASYYTDERLTISIGNAARDETPAQSTSREVMSPSNRVAAGAMDLVPIVAPEPTLPPLTIDTRAASASHFTPVPAAGSTPTTDPEADRIQQLLHSPTFDSFDYDGDDVNKAYARKRLQLEELKTMLPASSDESSKSKKKKRRASHSGSPAVVATPLDEKTIKIFKNRIQYLEGSLRSLRDDFEYDAEKANEEYVERQEQATARRRSIDRKRQDAEAMFAAAEAKAKQRARASSTSSTSSKSPVSPTLAMSPVFGSNDEDDDDQGGLFGGWMDMAEQMAGDESPEVSKTTVAYDFVDLNGAFPVAVRTPRQHLNDYAHKHAFLDNPKLTKECIASKRWRAGVTLKAPIKSNDIHISLPPGMVTENKEHAYELASLWALFTLASDSNAYLAMSPPFKDLWLKWKREKTEAENRPKLDADRRRFSFLVDTLQASLDRLPTSPSQRRRSSPFALSPEAAQPMTDTDWRAGAFRQSQRTFRQRTGTASYQAMHAQRQKLPISAYRNDLLEKIAAHQVVVLSGETGCGKSTQLPQFLAEELLLTGNTPGQVICTQPRRISALSIAQRVSLEMGDRPRSAGASDAMVGYQIRLENRVSAGNVLIYCTTASEKRGGNRGHWAWCELMCPPFFQQGILLRRLESDPGLQGVHYVIIDEVHERSIDSDFLLVILQRLCYTAPHLKVILMSATINAERFSAYFGNCPMVSIPGRTFPVDVYHLEDIVESLDYVLEDYSKYAVRKQRRTLAKGSLRVSSAGGNTRQVNYDISDSDDDASSDDDGVDAPSETLANYPGGYADKTYKMLRKMDRSKINYDLLMDLLERVCLVNAAAPATHPVKKEDNQPDAPENKTETPSDAPTADATENASHATGDAPIAANDAPIATDGAPTATGFASIFTGIASIATDIASVAAENTLMTSDQPFIATENAPMTTEDASVAPNDAKNAASDDQQAVSVDQQADLEENRAVPDDKQAAEEIAPPIEPDDGLNVPSTGAILVFLPGMLEIRKTYDLIASHSKLGKAEKFSLVVLHSSLSSEMQQKAFEIPENGVRKIVLSTNIAETGVTIPDVTVVIDTGMANIVSYHEKMRMTRLAKSFVAKANVNQRKGRAGRVQHGTCFRLFSSKTLEKMHDYETPEILRLPLEELCLRVKVLNLGQVQVVLSMALDAPPADRVDAAVHTLQELQALADDEHASLTPLGMHLADLPVDVHLGKMMLFGAILRCLDPILTIAAALSYKSPFLRPFGQEFMADEQRKKFQEGYSDFYAVHNAYAAWENKIDATKKSKTGAGWRVVVADWCAANFLSQKTLYMIKDLKKQYVELLMSIGFIHRDDNDRQHARASSSHVPKALNKYSHMTTMVHAAITAGLYPKVAIYNEALKKFSQPGRELMQIHPSSLLANDQHRLPSRLLIYNNASITNGNAYMWDTATIDILSLVLFAKDVDIKHKRQELIIDNWITMHCYGRTGVLVKFLRHELVKVLQLKMEKPTLDIEILSQGILDLLSLALKQ